MFQTDAYSSRAALMEALDTRLTNVDLVETERWRLRSLRRCLTALAMRTAPSDLAALLRQAAWLLDNRLDLSRAGWEPTIAALGTGLERFGITLRVLGQRWSVHLLHEGETWADWPEGLSQGLKLELGSRRVGGRASPDGALLRLSPHSAYQLPTQKAAIRALLTMPLGTTLMVSMPTGAGKSLLFQLGACWWREQDPEHPSCVVVIVPTVGLAIDHIQSLQRLPGLENCKALTGDLSGTEKAEILLQFLRGDVPILVMNPETAFQSAREALERVCQPRSERLGDCKAELAAVFVDEAHIIESWGRSFRPDFQRLVSLIDQLRSIHPSLRTVLLSATISDEARELLCRDYGHGVELLEIHARVPRYELDLFAKTYSLARDRDQALWEIVDRLPRPAIIYTTSRDQAQMIQRELKGRGYGAVETFSGDTDPAERRRILRAWRDDALDLIVATSAFGMGIDKADVRAVVHACLPEDAARYYQEVGRAGRDGHAALGICLWTERDAEMARSMRAKEWLTVDSSVERWLRIVERCQDLGRTSFSEAGRRLLQIDLNFAPERLGAHTGGRNRDWNQTLLNLMQRAEALRVLSVDKRTETWTVEVLNGRILDDVAVLRSIFELREDERRQSYSEFDAFRGLIQGEFCLLAETFQQTESERPHAHSCGRCGPCRREEEEAPEPDRVPVGGLTPSWGAPHWTGHTPPMPGTVLIEHDELDFGPLLSEQLPVLARLGYSQFLVPDNHVHVAAQLLRTAHRHPGLVLGYEERSVHRWGLYDLPTAALIDLAASDVYQQAFLRDHLRRPRGERPPLFLLARVGYQLDGRRLSQLVDTVYDLGILKTHTTSATTRGVEA
jgi:ATP-dependent DNA helicase RecQ